MALYANLRDYRFSDNVDDIRGAEIHGLNNEKLGKIDDVIFDNTTGDVRYLVVDTGGWLHAKKFMVPARQVMTSVEGEDRGYRVALDRDQIQRFPEYREEAIDRDEAWEDYERRYHDAYKLSESGDVLHREGTTNIITPGPNEMTAASAKGVARSETEPITMSRDEFTKEGTLRSEYDAPLEDRFVDRETRPTADSVANDADISGYAPDGGQRFRSFQERLRREREDILRRRNDRKIA